MTDAALHLTIELPADLGGGEAHYANAAGVTIGVPNFGPPIVLLALSEPCDRNLASLYTPLSPKRARALAASLVRKADEIEAAAQ